MALRCEPSTSRTLPTSFGTTPCTKKSCRVGSRFVGGRNVPKKTPSCRARYFGTHEAPRAWARHNLCVVENTHVEPRVRLPSGSRAKNSFASRRGIVPSKLSTTRRGAASGRVRKMLKAACRLCDVEPAFLGIATVAANATPVKRIMAAKTRIGLRIRWLSGEPL